MAILQQRRAFISLMCHDWRSLREKSHDVECGGLARDRWLGLFIGFKRHVNMNVLPFHGTLLLIDFGKLSISYN